MVDLIILKVPKEPRFTDTQLQTLVDILVGIGLVGSGTIAVPVILEKGSILDLSIGLVLSIFSWYIAFSIAGRIIKI